MKIRNPKRIILELTNDCNLRCIMCAQNHVEFDKSFLALSTIIKLNKFYESAEEVTLFGYGEPLLNSEFPEILKYFSNFKKLKTYLLTNGTLLMKCAEEIVKNNLTYLSISIDGGTEKTYKRIRKSGNFNTILYALTRIKELKSKYSTASPYIRFVFVAMKDNIRELPTLIEVANNLGVSEIKVEYLVAHSPEMIQQSLFYNKELLEFFKIAENRAREFKIVLKLPPLIGEDESGNSFHKECTSPFDTFFLSSNNGVRACMISNEIFGNINTDTPESIWRGEKMNSFRQRVNTQNPPYDCKFCWQASHLNVNRKDAHVMLNVNIRGQGSKRNESVDYKTIPR